MELDFFVCFKFIDWCCFVVLYYVSCGDMFVIMCKLRFFLGSNNGKICFDKWKYWYDWKSSEE